VSYSTVAPVPSSAASNAALIAAAAAERSRPLAAGRPGRPTTAEDLHRLAAQGHENGVVILTEARSGVHLATSQRQPGIVYAVNEHACSCHGFQRHARCSHYAVLLAALGKLPELPPPAAPAAVAPAAAPVIADISDLPAALQQLRNLWDANRRALIAAKHREDEEAVSDLLFARQRLFEAGEDIRVAAAGGGITHAQLLAMWAATQPAPAPKAAPIFDPAARVQAVAA
jgi:hypothetical protein